jgi:hypothetical protein
MRLYNVRGKLMTKKVSPYLIVWDGPSKSKIQFQVKQFLKPFWSGHICYEEFPVYGTLLKVDLLNATYRIAVEVQGPQHSEFHYFHGGDPFKYLESVKNDVKKLEWLEKNEFKFVEINFDEIELLSKEFFKTKFGVIL